MRALVGLWALAMVGAAQGDVTVLLTRQGSETVYRTYASGAPIADLPALDDSYTRVRAFGAAQDVIGPITLAGTRSTMLDVLVAAPAVTAMPNALAEIGRAGSSLAGLDASALGTRVRAAIAVSTITGAVDVGLVRRLDADSVDASVTARASNNQSEQAIDGVTIRRRIGPNARLLAISGTIGSVAVGQGLEGDGLFGAVESTGGKILSLEVSGEIRIAAPGGIRARDGIDLIRCTSLDETGLGAVNALIDTNTGQHAGFHDPRLGALIQLECDTLSGHVRTRSLDDGLGGLQRTTIRAGMVFAVIEIAESARGRVEVAGFEAPGRIDIGEDLGASIRAERDITSVTVGRNIEELFFCVPVEVSSATGAIGSLTVGGYIHANSACDASIILVRAPRGIGSFTVAGDMVCAVECGDTSERAPLGTMTIGGNCYGGFIEASRVESLDIQGWMDGAIHLDVLPEGSMVRTGQDRSGPVVIHDPQGLHGLIISNTRLETPTVSSGPVLVARDGVGWRAWNAPECPFRSQDLGGGMAGAAPFSLRLIDSVPASCGTCSPGVIAHDELEEHGVMLSFSGPVRKAAEALSPVQLFPADSTGQLVAGTPAWATPPQVQEVDARTLRVSFQSPLPAGNWVLVSRPGMLLCDRLMVAEEHAVTPFTFSFRVTGCGGADYNRDGDIGTDADIEAFFACLGGRCCPACPESDFNGDGDIGTDADIESFFRVLGGSPC
ncbi:MAG TPA: hypothetical protein VD997_12065 [Phycisphaerales bacterium]|nr:hypothetical protein [Phycisphaerales bacterium]